MPKRRKVSDRKLREAWRFLEQIARCFLDGEELADGSSYTQGLDDALETLTTLIRTARCLTGVLPGDLAEHRVLREIHGPGPVMLECSCKAEVVSSEWDAHVGRIMTHKGDQSLL